MTKNKTGGEAKIPLLQDVVVPGQPQEEGEPVAIVLSGEQMQRLSEEIQGIVQARLNPALRSLAQALSRELKKHLDQVLPALVEDVLKRQQAGKPGQK